MEYEDKRRRWKRGRISHLIISFRNSQGGFKFDNANNFNYVIELEISVLDIMKPDNTCLAMGGGAGSCWAAEDLLGLSQAMHLQTYQTSVS